MNFSLKLFCFVLVTVPLVTTTVSADCDDSDKQVCVDMVTGLTPTQMNDRTAVCTSRKDYIDCETSFLEKCPDFPDAVLLQIALYAVQGMHSDVCGEETQECPDGFKILNCGGEFFTEYDLGDTNATCKKYTDIYNCKLDVYKTCSIFPWLTKESLDRDKNQLKDLICQSGVSMTMSSVWVVLTLSAWSVLPQFL